MATYPRLHTVMGQATRAEINAGLTIVKPRNGRSRTVVDAWLRAIGNDVKTATAIGLTDTTTGTVAASFATAALTVGTVARAGDANTTATNLLATLGGGEGLKLIATGTMDAQTTAVDYCVKFVNT